MNRRYRVLPLALSMLLLASSAGAIPVLQIYIEGAVFDPQTETWVTTQSDFKLWLVGDVDAHGPIQNATLTASFFGLGPGSITFTPTTTTLVTDPSTPPAPFVSQSGNGGHPVLPPHGIFNDATLHHWTDYGVGTMSLTDSPIGDYSGSPAFPTTFPDNGQVNAYNVHVEGWTRVHFDGYGVTVNTTNGRESIWRTPGSHDGQVPVTPATWSVVKSLYGN